IDVIATCPTTEEYSETPDDCPPVDPNCHPWCIVYDRGHCRYCRCKEEESGGGSRTDIASSWENEISASSHRDDDTIEHPVYYEEKIQNSNFNGNFGPFSNLQSSSLSVPSPWSCERSAVQKPGYKLVKVPLAAPGTPRYCIRGPIVCPETCVRVDEWDCQSCPCHPAGMQTMCVYVKAEEDHKPQPLSCLSTTLCMLSCKGGYHLGERRTDSCQTCTCLKESIPHTMTQAPAPAAKYDCLEVLACMLKCENGYKVGKVQANGCQSCQCLEKSSTGNTGTQNTLTSGGTASKGGSSSRFWQSSAGGSSSGMQSDMGESGWSGTASGQVASGGSAYSSSSYSGGDTPGGVGLYFSGGGGSSYSSSGSGFGGQNVVPGGSGGSGLLDNHSNVVSSGSKCEPPLCFSADMSVDQAMEMGAASAGGGVGMNGVKAAAYNEDCFGPSCSAKNGLHHPI
ncbi:hypothetical protein CHS0354_008453, partial [Potamilus streckersoni]